VTHRGPFQPLPCWDSGILWDTATGLGHPETPLLHGAGDETPVREVPSTHPALQVSGAREGIGHLELLFHEKLAAAVRGFDRTEQTRAACSSQMLLCRNT